MKSLMKRIATTLIALVMAIGCTVSAFAAEPDKVDPSNSLTAISAEADEASEASTRSAGDVIGAASGTIYGGSGFLYVHLPTWNLWADIRAGIDSISQDYPVTCTVVTPDGNEIYLGIISGSGSRTGYETITYAPAGTYAFYFSSANTEPFDVCGFIYD